MSEVIGAADVMVVGDVEEEWRVVPTSGHSPYGDTIPFGVRRHPGSWIDVRRSLNVNAEEDELPLHGGSVFR